jgi:hypothetical protein
MYSIEAPDTMLMHDKTNVFFARSRSTLSNCTSVVESLIRHTSPYIIIATKLAKKITRSRIIKTSTLGFIPLHFNIYANDQLCFLVFAIERATEETKVVTVSDRST